MQHLGTSPQPPGSVKEEWSTHAAGLSMMRMVDAGALSRVSSRVSVTVQGMKMGTVS
jgi:hypothetical protein